MKKARRFKENDGLCEKMCKNRTSLRFTGTGCMGVARQDLLHLMPTQEHC